ncbi:MAG: antibiotic biosynthesis monooxygenase [Acidimicrobiales bacterium]|nr:antibiotic biosynthesis monooxygenase [Acidimicrobiales bacterium]
MIIVTGIYHVPPDQRDRFMRSRREQVKRTRQETGCLEYAFSADAEQAGVVRLIEQWESIADLEAHLRGVRSGPPPPQEVEVASSTFAVFDATPTSMP